MAIATEVSSSTAPLQPVKKAGQGTVSRDADVGEAIKRRRLGSNAATVTTAAAGAQSDTVTVTSCSGVATPSATHASTSSSSSAVVVTTTAQPTSASSPAAAAQRAAPSGIIPTSAVTGTSPSLDLTRWVPQRISSTKLRAKAGIDDQDPTALYVTARVHALHPPAQVPIVSRLVYQSNTAAQRNQTAFLLGPQTGFAIEVPRLPVFLTKTQADRGILQIDGPQIEWHTRLSTMASQFSGTLRDSRAAAEAKKVICRNLAQLLGDATKLWPKTELTTSWQEILCDGSAIKSYVSSRADNSKKPSETCYKLKLYAATAEAMFIVSCSLTAYSLLDTVCDETTAAWRQALRGEDSAATDSTDSSVSSDDDGWRQVRTGRRRPDKSSKRREHNIPYRMRDIWLNTPAETRARYACSTQRPLLALSTTLSLQPVTIGYTSYRIDNFQSLGCDTQRLADDPLYKQIVSAASMPRGPDTFWWISQHAGDAAVSLWGRDTDEFKAQVVQLNATVAGVLGLPAPATLRICCTMLPRGRNGRIDHSNPLTVYLTPTVNVSPPPSQRRAVIATVASSPPAPGSYAAAAGAGIKRAAELKALNHQPRKAQKAAPAADSTVTATSQLQHSSPPLSQSSQQRQPQKSTAAPPPARSSQLSGNSPGAAAQPLVTAQPSVSGQQLEQGQKELRQYCDERFEAVTSSVSKQLADMMVVMQQNMVQVMQSMMLGMRQMVQEVVQQMLQLQPRLPSQQPSIAMSDPSIIAFQVASQLQQQQPRHPPQQQQHSGAAFNVPATATADHLLASAVLQQFQQHNDVGRQLPEQHTDDGSVLRPASSSASAGPARNGQAVHNV